MYRLIVLFVLLCVPANLYAAEDGIDRLVMMCKGGMSTEASLKLSAEVKGKLLKMLRPERKLILKVSISNTPVI